ncbi:protein DDI1 homolog 2 isoform X1 [Carassius carassius]|uniref:protein DDI1 homolog 2 isoform X1 n=1 Tax=Carassius carassius TaxID=217509 RepID=UPI0028691628|nr:protein DDI1 homolog 2 isoform X1 [Carassius carassius]
MLLTVFCAPRDRSETTFALDVSPELELRDFLALCELESGIPAMEIQISYAEQPLQDPTRALGNYGLKDGDVIVLRQAERLLGPQPTVPGLPRIDFSSIAVPGTSSGQNRQHQAQRPSATQSQPPRATTAPGSALSPQGLDNPALLRDMLLANPHELSLLKERNPPLAEALLSGDLERFTKVLLEQQQDRARREQERIKLLTADPFDLEAQAKIEEEIRQHNIEENMTIAMEEAPESFGQVVMLYINCKVNGHPVKAFVDSGAQMTIMSQACAERCNIMRLVDRRWAGIAKGVGTQKIIGRVHLAQVQIEGDFLPCSFSILEDQPMDMLLGLDMLKRHQCSIDLKKNVLLIGTTGTETRFLPEAELPECARLAYGPEAREDTQPEEIADQELAEALQRSVQDSDIEDGKTTSPQSLPFKPLNQPTTSSASSHPHSLTLDRSKSAPASINQGVPPVDIPTSIESSLLQPLKVGEPSPDPSDDIDFRSQSQGLADPISSCLQTDADTPIPRTLPSQEPFSSTVSENNEVTGDIVSGDSGSPIDADLGKDNISSGTVAAESPFIIFNPRSQTQTLDHEVDMDVSSNAKPEAGHDFPDQCQRDQGSMMKDVSGAQPQLMPVADLNLEPFHAEPAISSVHSVSDSVVPCERNPPEMDNIPSLAQSLKELHKLLMSNNCPTRIPVSDADDTTPRQNVDEVDQNPAARNHVILNPTIDSSSSTATTNDKEESVAKADCTSQSMRDTPDLTTPSNPRHTENQPSSMVDPTVEQMIECPDEAEGNQALVLEEGSGQSESQQGQDIVDKNTSGIDISDDLSQQHPLSVAAGSSSNSSLGPVASPQATETDPLFLGDSIQPAPQPSMGQFPLEHIQRIQASGFSAPEAAEALEQAQGSVELALLVLLARKITVPT